MDKKHTVLLTVVAIATLLITVVGTTFAYFAATITGNDTAQEITISSQNITLAFEDGEFVNNTNIVPGWTGSKTITITNNGAANTPLKYAINWTAITNSFSSDDQQNYLKYTVTGESQKIAGGAGESAVATIDGEQTLPYIGMAGEQDGVVNLIPETVINHGEKHIYTINFNYKNNVAAPQESQGKEFKSKLVVEASTDID